VLAGILNWLGFPEVRCSVWRHAPRQRDELDRVEVLAARTPGFFSDWDAALPEEKRLEELLRTRTAPGATTLVLGSGEPLPDLPGRRLVAVDDAGQLEHHIAQGARYVALAGENRAADPALADRLAQSAVVVADEPGYRVYELRGTDDGDAARV
jgi:hypothetical protein